MKRRNRIKQQRTHSIEWKKYATKGMLIWAVLGVLVSIQIFFTIQTSTMGAELSVLEHKSIELTKKNQELKASLVSKSSLSDSQQKAETLGYLRPSKVVFVKENAPVTALR